eukprot:TRINITY_DN43051_c0_g1_i1.p1 TRINITY_DN43051_c0_g1~~TRINITY_DN43051_c0_g1_i1.p1  ORF type:complete len:305 (+),score=75.64 TRINITY_DN43051_c0_g1_i1:91-1005(+)
MGFKYVFIPADANDDMKELEYHSDITDLQKDTFREFVEKYFSSAGQDVDREVLMGQLKERTGVDVKEKASSGEMSNETLDRLLTATSVEIFPVQLPMKDTGFEGISVYCDDKGVAKNLEENPRVSGLVQACGYPGQTFRGDVFVGRVFDDNEDEWRRMDFTLKDCSTDAVWVAQTKKQRSNRSSSDMQSLAGKVGANNPALINPSMLGDSAPKGETAEYSWKQTEDEVEVTFKKEGLQKGDKKLVKVVFSRQRLKVEVKGEVIIDSELAASTNTDENTWTLSDGVLQVTLSKASEETWPGLLKA